MSDAVRPFRSRYTDEFVRRALLDYQSSGSQKMTAQRFGISQTTLASWRWHYGEVEEVEPPAPTAPPDYAIFDWLLAKLPPEGRWTQSQRDRWVAAFVAMIDLIIEVVDPPAPQEEPTTP